MGRKNDQVRENRLRKMREALMLSKAELARRAQVTAPTIGRIEDGHVCRTDTKRKILLALGLKLTDKNRVFPDDGAIDATEAQAEELVESLVASEVARR